MKKNISKFLALGLAMTAMVSCSDDLGLNSGKGIASEGGLTAELDQDVRSLTRAGVLEDNGNPVGLVFTENDEIRVFTADAMKFNSYGLTSGAGTTKGKFKLNSANVLPDGSETKYGITEASLVYGVTPDKEGNAVLTMTVPEEFTPEYKDGIAKFPAPYWGEVVESGGSGENIELDVHLTGLTAYLRVDINELPEGTKKIVLTTHGSANMQHGVDASHWATTDVHEEGFQLAPTMPASDTNKGWTEDADVQWITGGESEALSGTFNTILKKGNFLQVDPRLVHNDVLTVDLSKLPADSKIFYVPIIPNTYKNLFVLAVKGTSKYSYRWAGQILKKYTDFEFKGGLFYSLQMNMVNLGEVDINTLNQEIAAANTEAGRLTVMNVEKLVKDDGVEDNPDFNKTIIKAVGAGNLELNLQEIADDVPLTEEALQIDDANTVASESTPAANITKLGNKVFHTVYVNVPILWGATDAKKLRLNMPTTNVEFGTVEGENAGDKLTVDIFGAGSKFVSGTNAVNMTTGKIYDEKNAAIFIRNGVGTVNVLEKTAGDIFVYNGSETVQTEISNALNILAKKGNTIRITDALVNTLALVKNEPSNPLNHYVLTTGSAAMQAVIAYKDGNEWDTTTKFTTSFGNKIPGDKPNNAILQSYYTGSGLTDYAWASGYDCGTVYTVAQLQSLGEKARSNTSYSYNGYTEEISTNTASVTRLGEAVTSYVIPKELVSLMWLGDKHYPWLGANVNVGGFTLDGETTSLRNLNMNLDGVPGVTFYLDDPHICCTSCMSPTPLAPYGALAITKNIGLIRSIINTDKATVKNIDLNDVKFVSEEKSINNVGAIAGLVITPDFTLTDNYVGEPKISIPGKAIGGMVGSLGTTEKAVKLTATGNEVRGMREGGLHGYVMGADSIGGMIGAAKLSSAAVNQNIVVLKGDVAATGNISGGMVGYSKSTGVSTYNKNSVEVCNITAGGNLAAGLVAHLEAEDATGTAIDLTEDNVKATSITAAGQYAGGLVGYLANTKGTANDKGTAKILEADVNVTETIGSNEFAGGLVAQSNVAASTLWIASADVKANKVSATEGYVGGEVGQAYEGRTTIGYNGTDYESNIDIEILDGAYAAGGLVGNNKGRVDVLTGNNGTNIWSINIDIAKFTTPKDDAYYTGDYTQTQRAGTMSNVIGWTSSNVYIYDTELNVTDHLNVAMKEAVKYKLHSDETHNIAADGSQKYWGDAKGYVGWNGTGAYTVNGVNQLGDKETYGCNQWRTDAEYVD